MTIIGFVEAKMNSILAYLDNDRFDQKMHLVIRTFGPYVLSVH